MIWTIQGRIKIGKNGFCQNSPKTCSSAVLIKMMWHLDKDLHSKTWNVLHTSARLALSPHLHEEEEEEEIEEEEEEEEEQEEAVHSSHT